MANTSKYPHLKRNSHARKQLASVFAGRQETRITEGQDRYGPFWLIPACCGNSKQKGRVPATRI